MPAAIFSSSKVKFLKDRLVGFSDKDLIISGTVNPASSAVDATPGSLYLNSSTGQVFRKQDSGSTTNWTDISDSIGDDYIISKENFENNIGNASTTSTGCTVALNTTTELAGDQSLRCSTDTTDRTGGYFILDSFTNKKGLFSTVINFETLVSTSANYLDEDWSIVLYDITNATKIPFLPEGLLAGDGTYRGSAQTSADGISYEIRAYIDSDDLNARDVDFDNIKTYLSTPQTWIDTRGRQYSEAAGDFTVTGAGWTTTYALAVPYKTKDGAWRMRFNISGDVTSAARTSYTATISGVTAISSSQVILGNPIVSATEPAGGVFIASSGSLLSAHPSLTTIAYRFAGDVALASKPTWAIDDYPQILGEDAGQRAISAYYSGNGGEVITLGTENIYWASKIEDTHGAWDGEQFTAPITAKYIVSGIIQMTAPASNNVRVYVDGVASSIYVHLRIITTSTSPNYFLSGVIPLTKGEKLSFRVDTTDVTLVNTSSHRISINALQSPQQIAAGEKVVAKYTTVDSDVMTSGANEVVYFGTKEIDTHGAVTGTSFVAQDWKFTAPVTGYYNISANVKVNMDNNWDEGEDVILKLYLNNAFKTELDEVEAIASPASTTNVSVNASIILELTKGDYIDVRLLQNSGIDQSLYTLANNQISIHKI